MVRLRRHRRQPPPDAPSVVVAGAGFAISADPRDVYITIVGGGATGVEVAGTLAELRNVAGDVPPEGE